ncbi:MAG: hypothetical protein LBQ50_03610 [Planctomycetaceae bacterium]|nr:hypothetical protein [Planctomycetaceae bacterium]
MMHNRRCSAAQPPDRIPPHNKVAQRRHHRAKSLSSHSLNSIFDDAVAARLGKNKKVSLLAHDY